MYARSCLCHSSRPLETRNLLARSPYSDLTRREHTCDPLSFSLEGFHMAVTLDQKVHQDPAYQEIAQKRMTSREKLIEQVCLKVGERELGRIRRENTRLQGLVTTTRLEGQVAVIETKLAVQGSLMKRLLSSKPVRLAFTPYSELYHELTNENRPALPEAIEVAARVVEDAEAKTNSDDSNTAVSADADGVKQVGDATAEVSNQQPADTKGSVNPSRRLVAGLPDWVKVLVGYVEMAMKRLTPATSAVLLVLIMVGAYFLSEWSKANVTESLKATTEIKDTLSKENERLKDFESKFQLTADELKNLQMQHTATERTLKSAQDEVQKKDAELEQARKDRETKILELIDRHKAEIAAASTNADQGLKDQAKRLEDENTAIKTERDGLARSKAELEGQVKELVQLRKDAESFRTTSELATRTVNSLQQQLTEANRKVSDLTLRVTALAGFAKSLTTAVSPLYNASSRGLSNAQDQFAKDYKLIFKAANKELEAEGIPARP